MMPVELSDFGTVTKKLHAGHKVFHFPIFANPLAVVRKVPARKLLELRVRLLKRTGIDAAFAGQAFFLGQFGRGLGLHNRLELREGLWQRFSSPYSICFVRGCRQFTGQLLHLQRWKPRLNNIMTNNPPTNESKDLSVQVVELEHKLTFQQLAFDQLNGVVLEQQAELESLRRELKSLRLSLNGLADRGAGEDLPHEKPPHY